MEEILGRVYVRYNLDPSDQIIQEILEESYKVEVGLDVDALRRLNITVESLEQRIYNRYRRIILIREQMRRDTIREVDIRDRRRCGNTTRQIDAAVQELFTMGTVCFQDHAGYIEEANKHAFRKLIRRLAMEHHAAYVDCEVEKNKYTITLKK